MDLYPRELNSADSTADALPAKRASLLRKLVSGWIFGGLMAYLWCFFFLSPTMHQVPVVELTILLTMLGAIIGGGINRRLIPARQSGATDEPTQGIT